MCAVEESRKAPQRAMLCPTASRKLIVENRNFVKYKINAFFNTRGKMNFVFR